MPQLVSNLRIYAFKFMLLQGALLLCLGRPSFGQTWAASTGEVDESSRSTYVFTGSAAYVAPSVSSGSVTLRYNIVPAGNLGQQIDLVTNCWSMGVRYLDNGNNAQVTVSLQEHNLTTGKVNTLLTFDSNTAAPGNSFQNGNPLQCGFFNFTFASNGTGKSPSGNDSVYYFEAKLSRTAAGGTPGLDAIWLNEISAQ